jgi:hypothetical protein
MSLMSCSIVARLARPFSARSDSSKANPVSSFMLRVRPMTRDAFVTEFTRGMRYVIQKAERVNIARGFEARTEAHCNLEGAIHQLADHLFDALEAMQHEAHA